jgi:hypothetical protein
MPKPAEKIIFFIVDIAFTVKKKLITIYTWYCLLEDTALSRLEQAFKIYVRLCLVTAYSWHDQSTTMEHYPREVVLYG